MQTSGAVAQLMRPDGAFYNNALVRQPLSLLCRAMRLANLATGALLVLTGVLGLLSALTHVSLTVLTSALLSFYVGGTGAMLLLHELRRTGKRYGVVSMCIGTGMGAAAVFEAE